MKPTRIGAMVKLSSSAETNQKVQKDNEKYREILKQKIYEK